MAFSDSSYSNIYLDIFNAIIDFFFILDVIVNFRTSYIKEATGEEITNLRVIAWQYIKTRFMIDLIASIPVDILTYIYKPGEGSGFTFDSFSLLKLVRVLRLSRLITYLNLKNDLKMSLKLGKLVFFLLLFLHLLACSWYWIVERGNQDWIPPLDYVYITTELYSYTAFHKY